MGVIAKQSFRGTIFSYLGVFLGFITTGLVYPRILSTDQIGLINLLVSYAMLFGIISSLGINTVTLRIFPFFRNKENGHHGYFMIPLAVSMLGFILVCLAFLLLKDGMISRNEEKSELFVKFIYMIIPLTFFQLLFIIFDGLNRVLYNVVLGMVLKEFILRLLILVSIGLFYFSIISFKDFIHLYAIMFSVPALVIVFYRIIKGDIKLKTDFSFLTKEKKREIFSTSIFGFLASIGTIAVATIDKIMINAFTDLSKTGIYSIAFYFGTLVIIPSRALFGISVGVISEAWKNNDKNLIKTIYYKSCLNQWIIGLILLIGIWINIDNVFKIIPAEYEAGKYVILFIGLANLLDMATGINGTIINTSRYYRYQALFVLFFAILVVTTNYIFIPLFGINGAAFASLISIGLYNIARYLFLLIKYKFQPFSFVFLIPLLIGAAVFGLDQLIPTFENVFVDILIRSTIIATIYFGLVYLLKISKDLNDKIKDILKFVKL